MRETRRRIAKVTLLGAVTTAVLGLGAATGAPNPADAHQGPRIVSAEHIFDEIDTATTTVRAA